MSVKVIGRIELPVVVTTYKCCTCEEFKVVDHFICHPSCTPYPECVECQIREELSFDRDHWFVKDRYNFRKYTHQLDDL
jgi:hypothetical protein